MQTKCYITTSIPYVNAKPHIGHALELVQADAVARYLKLSGVDVTFQTGTDENAHKNVAAAQAIGVPVQQLVDENAENFRNLVSALDTAPNSFIRTTEGRHRIGVQKLWGSIDQRDIYKQSYQGLYCEGCEDFLSARDLVDSKCPDHLALPTPLEESNYFFRLSKYQGQIEKLIESDAIRIHPRERKREVLAFIRSGLRDISISRQAERMGGWGIPVPGDKSQVIYVWIDALINYITGIGYGSGDQWREIWNHDTRKIHVIGKNVWKFHAVYWPALLLSAGLNAPDEILIHGFLTAEGKKISKSLGNAIDPMAEIEAIGSDALRLYLLSFGTFSDGDYSKRALIQTNNRQLAERLGSTVTRVTALCARFGLCEPRIDQDTSGLESFHEAMSRFRIDHALNELLALIDKVNKEIAELRPWETGVDMKEVAESLDRWISQIYSVSYWLGALAPRAAELIENVFKHNPIQKPEALFPKAPVIP
jgi:methionyl-tRNA synthetase